MLFSQNLGAFFIITNLLTFSVLAAIQFDTKFRFVAIEVEDKTGKRMLSAEFCVVDAAIAENIPHELFGFGGVLT